MPIDITHYQRLARDGTGRVVAAGHEPAISNQQVAVTAGSLQSTAFPDGTSIIRVHSDATCRIMVGDNPTAAATSKRCLAGVTEYFGVMPGHKLAVIQST